MTRKVLIVLYVVVGEIFICGPDTKGVLLLADYFLGRVISGIGGGEKKIFVMEGI